MPEATWSPCRWRKLFAVDAADRASENETEEGSLRALPMVFSAACLSAHEVPCDGGWVAEAVDDVEPILEKRD